MIANVKDFVKNYVTLDEPIPYKGLLIKPIKVRDYYKFGAYSDVLHIEKNEINDFDVIQMSYLDFIFEYLMCQTQVLDEALNYTLGDLYREKFLSILLLTISDLQDVKSYKKSGHNILLLNESISINADEFDDIRRIIMYQNLYNYSDEYVNPEIKEAMEEYYSVKNQGISYPTLEEQISYFTAMTGILKKDILDLTYREFEMAFNAAKDKLDYQISRTAELSGMVKFNKPVEHWIYKKEKSKYDGVFTNYNNFKNKII